MKKAQVLSALALAFALGVVAPVANTVVSGNVFAEETKPRSATKCDLLNAVAKIRGYSQYENYEAVYDLVDFYNNEKSLYNSSAKLNTVLNGKSIATLRTAIESGIQSVKRAVDGNPSLTWTFTPAGISLASAITTAKETVSTAEYNLYEQLFELLQKKDSELDANTLGAAADRIATFDYSGKRVETIREQITNPSADGAWGRASEYVAYSEMIIATKNAETYVKFVDDMELALRNAKNWGNSTDVNDALEATNPASSLVALATATKLPGYGTYSTLIAKVNAVDDMTDFSNEVYNQDIIDDLDKWLKAASKEGGAETNLSKLTFNGTCGTADNEGTGEGTNKPGDNTDDKKDPNAPDTGLLADAEANASTTVAMVAGIATALTAAGAGVVAYRNARRSTRK